MLNIQLITGFMKMTMVKQRLLVQHRMPGQKTDRIPFQHFTGQMIVDINKTMPGPSNINNGQANGIVLMLNTTKFKFLIF